jgi:hypothetical protein
MITRRPNPRNRPILSDCCSLCAIPLPARRRATCKQQQSSPLCVACAKTLRAHFREEERRERAYRSAKAARVARQEQEREKRRQERVALEAEREDRSANDSLWS